MKPRVYLDWNASAPLRPEAAAAMRAAMEQAGNPSSVHGEGRRAKAITERARAQVAAAFGATAGDIVFTSGATEAAALALSGQGLASGAIEHDCVAAWTDCALPVSRDGAVTVADPAKTALQAANSETGILQHLSEGLAFIDAAQLAGRLPFAFDWTKAVSSAISGHKFGGPAGAGCLLLRSGTDLPPLLRGGGQEQGRRAGTENIVGIAGLGAAAEAAARDIADGVWQAVAELRDLLEQGLKSVAAEVICIGEHADRLPNTTCFAVPGWKGETQVMQSDLDGFAISAGSACSSGKVRASRVLQAMEFGDNVAASAVRVSLGPATRSEDILAFVGAWEKHYRRFRQKAA